MGAKNLFYGFLGIEKGQLQLKGFSALLLLYFLNSCVVSFPMTAYNDWLNNYLEMSPADIARYQSFAFTPWMFKPLYGWISNTYTIRGENRRPYLFISFFLSALCYVITALYVQSLSATFLMGFFRAICESFSELVLGMVLIDLASDETNNLNTNDGQINGDKDKPLSTATILQSAATAARFSGTVAALLLGLPVYGCTKQLRSDTRVIIGMNAIFPVLGMIVCLYLPGKTSNKNNSLNVIEDEGTERNIYMNNNRGKNQGSKQNHGFVFILGMILILTVLVWTSQRSIISTVLPSGSIYWETVEVVLLLLLGFFFLRAFSRYSGLNETLEVESDLSKLYFRIFVSVGFLLLVNITSSLDSPWSSYYYSLFHSGQNCKIQLISLSTSVASLIACAFYVKWLSTRSLASVLTLTLLAAAFAPILRLPAISNDAGVTFNSTWNVLKEEKHMVFGMDPALYLSLIGFVTAFTGRLAFLALQVLATRSSCVVGKMDLGRKCEGNPGMNSVDNNYVLLESSSGLGAEGSESSGKDSPTWLSAGFIYSIYLSCIDFADTASGWINAPIIESMNLSEGNWNGLYLLTVIACASKAVSVFLVPFMKLSQLNAEATTAAGEDETVTSYSDEWSDADIIITRNEN